MKSDSKNRRRFLFLSNVVFLASVILPGQVQADMSPQETAFVRAFQGAVLQNLSESRFAQRGVGDVSPPVRIEGHPIWNELGIDPSERRSLVGIMQSLALNTPPSAAQADKLHGMIQRALDRCSDPTQAVCQAMLSRISSNPETRQQLVTQLRTAVAGNLASYPDLSAATRSRLPVVPQFAPEAAAAAAVPAAAPPPPAVAAVAAPDTAPEPAVPPPPPAPAAASGSNSTAPPIQTPAEAEARRLEERRARTFLNDTLARVGISRLTGTADERRATAARVIEAMNRGVPLDSLQVEFLRGYLQDPDRYLATQTSSDLANLTASLRNILTASRADGIRDARQAVATALNTPSPRAAAPVAAPAPAQIAAANARGSMRQRIIRQGNGFAIECRYVQRDTTATPGVINLTVFGKTIPLAGTTPEARQTEVERAPCGPASADGTMDEASRAGLQHIATIPGVNLIPSTGQGSDFCGTGNSARTLSELTNGLLIGALPIEGAPRPSSASVAPPASIAEQCDIIRAGLLSETLPKCLRLMSQQLATPAPTAIAWREVGLPEPAEGAENYCAAMGRLNGTSRALNLESYSPCSARTLGLENLSRITTATPPAQSAAAAIFGAQFGQVVIRGLISRNAQSCTAMTGGEDQMFTLASNWDTLRDTKPATCRSLNQWRHDFYTSHSQSLLALARRPHSPCRACATYGGAHPIPLQFVDPSTDAGVPELSEVYYARVLACRCARNPADLTARGAFSLPEGETCAQYPMRPRSVAPVPATGAPASGPAR